MKPADLTPDEWDAVVFSLYAYRRRMRDAKDEVELALADSATEKARAWRNFSKGKV